MIRPTELSDDFGAAKPIPPCDASGRIGARLSDHLTITNDCRENPACSSYLKALGATKHLIGLAVDVFLILFPLLVAALAVIVAVAIYL
jgi:uncharacterized membrane protein